MIIAVCGNIASGKTTLAMALARKYNFRYIPSKRMEMTFLDDFFDDIKNNFLQTQIAFLISKAMQIKEACYKGESIVLDRSMEEDIHVFAKMWMEKQKIDERIRQLYLETAEYIYASLPPVDLYIMCECDVGKSRERFQARERRKFEEKYPENYIEIIDAYLSNIEFPSKSSYIKVNSAKWDFTDEHIMDEILAEIFDRYNKEIDDKYMQMNIFSNTDGKKQDMPIRYIDVCQIAENANRIELKEIIRKKAKVYFAAPFTGMASEVEQGKDSNALHLLQNRKHGILPEAYKKQLMDIRNYLVKGWGVEVILPHKDVNLWGERELTSDIVLREIVRKIEESDFMIAVPSDSIGVHFEIGYALAQKIPIIIFDIRELRQSFYVENFDVLEDVKKIEIESWEELIKELKKKSLQDYIKEKLKEKKAYEIYEKK